MTLDQLKHEYQAGDVLYLDAIEALQNEFGYSSREAENIVEQWGVDDK